MPTAGATRTRSRTYPAEGTAKIEALQAEITDAVGALVEDSAWRAMLDTVARFYRYRRASLVAARCQDREPLLALADRPAEALPSLEPGNSGGYKTTLGGLPADRELVGPAELLTGDAPANLWDRLTDQLEAAGYTVLRGECPSIWGGYTDAAARTVTVRAGVDDAQAVTTLAHELAHILCGHTADDYDYGAFKHRAEVEAESVASIVTTWAGVYSAAPTVPHVAYRISRRPEAVRETVETVTAVARAVIDALDPDTTTQAQPTLAVAAN